MIVRLVIAWVAVFAVALAHAQNTQPYAGQQLRALKALSQDEVKQYLEGAGLGYAKAAELNHYPGPMHVLELADKLQLTTDQRARTAELMLQHKAEARALGRKLVEAEAALDELFHSARVERAALAAHVQAVAAAQGEYRLSHLETHRRMRALLSDEQVSRYDALRGYAAGAAHAPHSKGH